MRRRPDTDSFRTADGPTAGQIPSRLNTAIMAAFSGRVGKSDLHVPPGLHNDRCPGQLAQQGVLRSRASDPDPEDENRITFRLTVG